MLTTRRLADAHFDRVYGLLSMLAPNRDQAAAAAADAFVEASNHLPELPPQGNALVRWLVVHGAQQLTLPSIDPATPSPKRLVAASPRAAAALNGVSASTLRILVRALEPARRAALTLRFLTGVSEQETARLLRTTPREVRKLVSLGAVDISARLEAYHARRNQPSPTLATRPAPHLRPLPYGSSGGIIVVRGDKAYVTHGPPKTVAELAQRLIERFFAWLHRREVEELLDDDVGQPRQRAKTPEPTPTLRPFTKPKPTPSMQGFRRPEATRGTGSYRSPKSTPSTARLSNPARPPGGGASVYGAQTKKW